MNRTPVHPSAGWIPFLVALLTASCSPSQDAALPPTTPPLTAEALADRAGAAVDALQPLQRIAFGSCSRTDLPQPLWDPILAARPDLWIWLGDNVYGDTDDMSVMREKYEAALAVPGYAALRAVTPIVATWDDHDYGSNNAGSEYAQREASQRELMDFAGEPLDSPRRERAGVYTSYTYGDVGERVKLILLDSRYHRGPEGPGQTILGDAQWQWLEAELTGSDAQIHVIAGGFQFLPVDHSYEKWANFPDERARLLDLIARTDAPGVVLLSGDRHISEIMRVQEADLRYPLYEVTSSGMTHSWLNNPGEPNRYRVGDLYTDLGFGLIEVDWEGRTISLQLRDRAGDIAVEERVVFATLGIE